MAKKHKKHNHILSGDTVRSNKRNICFIALIQEQIMSPSNIITSLPCK